MLIENDPNGEKKVWLHPHWSKSNLQSITTSYDSLNAHNEAFFELILQECIESSLRGDPTETVRHK